MCIHTHEAVWPPETWTHTLRANAHVVIFAFLLLIHLPGRGGLVMSNEIEHVCGFLKQGEKRWEARGAAVFVCV